LFVSNFPQKLPNGFAWNFQRRLAINEQMNKWLNFGGDPYHRSRSVSRSWLRRAYADVCTVPMLVVLNVELRFCFLSSSITGPFTALTVVVRWQEVHSNCRELCHLSAKVAFQNKWRKKTEGEPATSDSPGNTHTQPFYVPFLGPPRWAWRRRSLRAQAKASMPASFNHYRATLC